MKVPEEKSNPKTGAVPLGYIKEVNPELIVSYDIFIEAFLKSEFSQRYIRFREPLCLEDDLKLARTNKLWGSKNLNVFIRKDLFYQVSCKKVFRPEFNGYQIPEGIDFFAIDKIIPYRLSCFIVNDVRPPFIA